MSQRGRFSLTQKGAKENRPQCHQKWPKRTVPIGTARCVTAQNKPDNNNLRLKKMNNEPYFVYI